MFNVDIEYDRMVKDDLEYYEKKLSCDCGKTKEEERCEICDKCYQVIANEIRKNKVHCEVEVAMAGAIRKAVRPDIIVHNRNGSGIANNGLVVEFKKDHEGVDKDAIAFDIAKIYYFTCPQSEHLQYRMGAMVMLRPKYADVGFIYDKNILCGRKVFANSVDVMERLEVKLEPWRKPSSAIV